MAVREWSITLGWFHLCQSLNETASLDQGYFLPCCSTAAGWGDYWITQLFHYYVLGPEWFNRWNISLISQQQLGACSPVTAHGRTVWYLAAWKQLRGHVFCLAVTPHFWWDSAPQTAVITTGKIKQWHLLPVWKHAVFYTTAVKNQCSHAQYLPFVSPLSRFLCDGAIQHQNGERKKKYASLCLFGVINGSKMFILSAYSHRIRCREWSLHCLPWPQHHGSSLSLMLGFIICHFLLIRICSYLCFGFLFSLPACLLSGWVGLGGADPIPASTFTLLISLMLVTLWENLLLKSNLLDFCLLCFCLILTVASCSAQSPVLSLDSSALWLSLCCLQPCVPASCLSLLLKYLTFHQPLCLHSADRPAFSLCLSLVKAVKGVKCGDGALQDTHSPLWKVGSLRKLNWTRRVSEIRHRPWTILQTNILGVIK